MYLGWGLGWLMEVDNDTTPKKTNQKQTKINNFIYNTPKCMKIKQIHNLFIMNQLVWFLHRADKENI